MTDYRPEWMEGGTTRPKPQPRPYVPVTDRARTDEQGGTHRNVVIGVTLLALVSLFTFFFWLTIVLIGVVNPPDPFESGMTWIRVLLAVAAGGALTRAAWAVADDMIRP